MYGTRNTRAEKRREMPGLGITVHEGFAFDKAL
jgi:hypothetical protein